MRPLRLRAALLCVAAFGAVAAAVGNSSVTGYQQGPGANPIGWAKVVHMMLH